MAHTSRQGDRSRPADMRPSMQDLLRRGKSDLLEAMSATPHVLKRGQALVQMEGPHEYVYLIESGWLIRYRTTPDGRRQIILILLPGDICDIKSLFLTRQQDAIEAITLASVRRAHHDEVCSLATARSSVALYLGWRFAQDERRLHNWIVRLGRASAEERLASFLLETRNRLRLLGMSRSETGFTFPMTLQQIADHIGMTRVHVGRILQRFRASNILRIQHNQLILLENINQLEQLAEPVFDEIGSLSEDV